MKRYWDHSEKDRAAMPSEAVEQLLDAELMEAGVVRIESPTQLPTEVPEIPGSLMFVVKYGYGTPAVAYKTAEDAAEAMAKAVGLDHDYIGGDFKHKPNPKATITIEPLTVYEAAEIANNRKAYEQAAANKKANDKAAEEYRAACKAVDDVCQGVWDDWHKCRFTERRYQRIVDTFREYQQICDGDQGKAKVFLAKAFPQPDIEAALVWFGLESAVSAA